MQNVEFSIKGKTLTITVDLSKEFGDSGSGKTTIIASTKGNVPIDTEGRVMGLNIYKRK
jgi:ABC-type glutathione transport system ATPase component